MKVGHITYMRTDSTFISDEYQKKIQTHLSSTYDNNYYQAPKEKKKVLKKPTKLSDLPLFEREILMLMKHPQTISYDVQKNDYISYETSRI